MNKNIEVIKANTTYKYNDNESFNRIRVAAYCRVSTNDEDQLSSYKSQVDYYTDLIKGKTEWSFAGIYADEAITGTQVIKRESFQRLINDCMNGEIDLVITKSISRFARNTLDTLQYVRTLKEKNVAILFEEENINTLTMDGELLLVVLSSVAQQEVENISANVQKGLRMKMQRGELVGFQGCLGYDYHPENKTITVNQEEAEIVKYIFRRYIEGAGGMIISRELRNLGYKTKRGRSTWPESTVIGIIKNEKYKGDILLQKTFTVDPISKRRLNNIGEKDQYYIRNHHEPIVSEEVFSQAQSILQRRSKARNLGTSATREKFSRKYPFSCMLECGFCGSNLSRRSWHGSSQYRKIIWHCVTSTKKGKKHCPDSKGISEEIIENAFIESYNILSSDNADLVEEFLKRAEETFSINTTSKQLVNTENEIKKLIYKRTKLVDMRLEEILDKETYEQKYLDLSVKIEKLEIERSDLEESDKIQTDLKMRMAAFRKTLEKTKNLESFDRFVFESIVDKVIVGGYDEDGNKDPYRLTFIYKTGMKDKADATEFNKPRKNAKVSNNKLSSCSSVESNNMSSCHCNNTR